MPSKIQGANISPHATRDLRSWVWFLPALALVGFLIIAQLFSFASHFRNAGVVVMLGVLAGIPALVALALALRQGFAYVREFAPTFTWWHMLWALTVVSSLVFRQRMAADIASEPLDAWAVFRVAVDMVVVFVLLARLSLRRTHWLGSMFRGVVGALSIYGLVCTASTAWSVFPSWTLFKSWEYLIDIALLAAVLETLDCVEQYRSFFNWTWTLYGLLLLSIWKDVVLWPKDALYGENLLSGAALGIRLSGVIPALSSNDVATFSSILAMLSLTRLFPASDKERFQKLWYAFLLLVSFISLVLSQTRAALVGVMFGGLIILLYSKRAKFGAFLTFIAAPVVALCTMGGLIWSFMARGQDAEQMGTLSSRTEWWGMAWNTFLQQPLTGFGAYAAGRFAVLAKAGFGGTGTMHSDYLEVIVGTGIWGLIPLLAALVGTWWLLWRFVRDSVDDKPMQLAYEGLAILALLTFRSIFNNMLTIHPPLPFLAILGYAEFLRRRRKALIEHDTPYLSGLASAEEEPKAEPVPDWESPL